MGHYLELGLIPFIIIGGKLIIKFCFLSIFFKNGLCPGPVSALTGIQFGDNGGQIYVTEENGVAVATTEVSLLLLINNCLDKFCLDFLSIDILCLDLSTMEPLGRMDGYI